VKTQALKQLHQILVCKDAFSKQSGERIVCTHNVLLVLTGNPALSALKSLRESSIDEAGTILGISMMLELLSSSHSDFNTKQKTISFFLSLGGSSTTNSSNPSQLNSATPNNKRKENSGGSSKREQRAIIPNVHSAKHCDEPFLH